MMSGIVGPGVETVVEGESWSDIANNLARSDPESVWEALEEASEGLLLEWRNVLVDSSSNHFLCCRCCA